MASFLHSTIDSGSIFGEEALAHNNLLTLFSCVLRAGLQRQLRLRQFVEDCCVALRSTAAAKAAILLGGSALLADGELEP